MIKHKPVINLPTLSTPYIALLVLLLFVILQQFHLNVQNAAEACRGKQPRVNDLEDGGPSSGFIGHVNASTRVAPRPSSGRPRILVVLVLSI